MPEIPDFAVTSFIVQMAYLFITLVLVVCLLRWFDRSAGIKFRVDVWETIHERPMALAVYHGVRFFSVCYLASRFLS